MKVVSHTQIRLEKVISEPWRRIASDGLIDDIRIAHAQYIDDKGKRRQGSFYKLMQNYNDTLVLGRVDFDHVVPVLRPKLILTHASHNTGILFNQAIVCLLVLSLEADKNIDLPVTEKLGPHIFQEYEHLVIPVINVVELNYENPSSAADGLFMINLKYYCIPSNGDDEEEVTLAIVPESIRNFMCRIFDEQGNCRTELQCECDSFENLTTVKEILFKSNIPLLTGTLRQLLFQCYYWLLE